MHRGNDDVRMSDECQTKAGKNEMQISQTIAMMRKAYYEVLLFAFAIWNPCENLWCDSSYVSPILKQKCTEPEHKIEKKMKTRKKRIIPKVNVLALGCGVDSVRKQWSVLFEFCVALNRNWKWHVMFSM